MLTKFDFYMSRPNKCIKDENGNEVWISRSTVVIPVVFKLDENTGDIYTLVEKRGKAVSHPGEWCCPCGYLDWDETLIDACVREVREETGLELNPDKITFVTVESNIHSSNQSVDLWYFCMADEGTDIDVSKIETSDEVLELRWMRVGKLYYTYNLFGKKLNLNIYKKTIYNCYGPWAFKTHKDKIIDMLKIPIKDGKITILDE